VLSYVGVSVTRTGGLAKSVGGGGAGSPTHPLPITNVCCYPIIIMIIVTPLSLSETNGIQNARMMGRQREVDH
jgi:hypothetical protein